MTDIYDIKHIFLPWNDFIVSTIITIVLFLIVYFLLFKKKKKFVEIVEKVDEVEKEKTSFKELILNFEKSCFSLETKDFLKELSFIFRTFLEEEKGYKNFSKLTLFEVKSLNSSLIKENRGILKQKTESIFKVLESIYFAEYEGKELTEKQKEKMFLEVKDIIFKEEN